MAAYLEALRLGAPGELRLLREGHPALAAEFASLESAWNRLGPLLARGGTLSLAGRRSLSAAPPNSTAHGNSIAGSHPTVAPAETDALLERIAANAVPFERYRDGIEIARGGMGSIQRVWDTDLRRHLVMKVMLSAKDRNAEAATRPPDQRLLSRFLEEAQLTGQLDHPGILPVHDLGLDPEGRLYFTMPLVKGSELGDVIELYRDEDEEWTRPRLLGALLKAMEAVAYAHSRGVIHRDLKPDNIMVGRFGETYVMDWGLARVLEQAQDDAATEPDSDSEAVQRRAPLDPPSAVFTARSDEQRDPHSALVTLDGDMIGTPGYMAPEQTRGDRARIGPRADVYAMGAILYQILTGSKPYDDPLSRASKTPLLQRILEERPVGIERLTDDVPSELRAIAEKAMAEDQSERYASMVEMTADLRAYQEGRVVTAYETGVVAEFKKWLRRNTLAAGALALLALGGLGAGTVLLVQQQRSIDRIRVEQALTEEQKSIAEANAADAERKRQEAEEALIKAERAEMEERQQGEIAEALRQKAISAEGRLEEALAVTERALDEALFSGYTANLLAAEQSLREGLLAEARRRLEECNVELRGFEWQHLWLRTDTSLESWEAHAGGVTGLAGGPQRVVTIGADLELALWDTSADRVGRSGALQRWTGPAPGILVPRTAVAFQTQGEWIAFGRADGSLFLQQPDAREPIALLPPAPGGARPIHALAFSPDGAQLAVALEASAADRRIALVLDVERSALARRALVQFSEQADSRGAGTALAWDPRGRRLALGRGDGRVAVLDTRDSVELVQIDAGRGRPVDVLCFDPSGTNLITSGPQDPGHPLVLWNSETGGSVGSFNGHEGPVRAARFTADGRFLVSGSDDRTLRLWSALDRGSPARAVLRGHLGPVSDLLLLGPNGPILSGSQDGTLRLWNLYSGESLNVVEGLGKPGGRAELQFTADGAGLVAWRESGPQSRRPSAQRIDAADLSLGPRLSDSDLLGIVHALPDGLRAASVSPLGSVGIWSLDDARQLEFGPRTSGMPRLSCLAPSGARIAVVEELSMPGLPNQAPRLAERIQVWRLPANADDRIESLGAIELDGVRVEALAFVDSNRLVAACSDGLLRLYRVGEGRLERTLTPPNVSLEIALRFATRIQMGVLQWLCAPSIAEPPVLLPAASAARGQFTALDVAQRTAQVATGDTDGRVLLWDLDEQLPVPQAIEGHRERVHDLEFTPDGRRLVSACADGNLRLFDVQRGGLVAVLRGAEGVPLCACIAPDGERIAAYFSSGVVQLYETSPRAVELSASRELAAAQPEDGLTSTLLSGLQSAGLAVPIGAPLLGLAPQSGTPADELVERGKDWMAGVAKLFANPARDNDLAWRSVCDAQLGRAEYEAALERAESAVDGSSGPAQALYRRTLATAHYRLEQWPEALEQLDLVRASRDLRPEELALEIACLLRRGRPEAAHSLVLELEALMVDPFWARDPIAQAFAEEARAALAASGEEQGTAPTTQD